MESEATYNESCNKYWKQTQNCLRVITIADYYIAASLTKKDLVFFCFPLPCMIDTGSQLLWHENLRQTSECIGGMAILQWVRVHATGRVICSPHSLPLILSSSTYPLAACRRQVKARCAPIYANLACSLETVTQIKPFVFCLPYCCVLHSITYCLSVPTFYLPIGIKLPLNRKKFVYFR